MNAIKVLAYRMCGTVLGTGCSANSIIIIGLNANYI